MKAGLLIRVIRSRSNREGKRATSQIQAGNREEGRETSVKGNHLLGHDRASGDLRGVCGQAEVVFREKWTGRGVTQGSSWKRRIACPLLLPEWRAGWGRPPKIRTSGGRRALYKGTLLLTAQLSRSQGGVMLTESLMGPGAV